MLHFRQFLVLLSTTGLSNITVMKFQQVENSHPHKKMQKKFTFGNVGHATVKGTLSKWWTILLEIPF